jgi:hypothetical protein
MNVVYLAKKYFFFVKNILSGKKLDFTSIFFWKSIKILWEKNTQEEMYTNVECTKALAHAAKVLWLLENVFSFLAYQKHVG